MHEILLQIDGRTRAYRVGILHKPIIYSFSAVEYNHLVLHIHINGQDITIFLTQTFESIETLIMYKAEGLLASLRSICRGKLDMSHFCDTGRLDFVPHDSFRITGPIGISTPLILVDSRACIHFIWESNHTRLTS